MSLLTLRVTFPTVILFKQHGSDFLCQDVAERGHWVFFFLHCSFIHFSFFIKISLLTRSLQSHLKMNKMFFSYSILQAILIFLALAWNKNFIRK